MILISGGWNKVIQMTNKEKKDASGWIKVSRAIQEPSRNIYAVYGQYDYKFDEKNEFIFGARETWTTGGYKDQNYDNFSMSGQYLHKLTENDSLYASVGQSFIMPTFSQMYGASDSAVSNPDLKPQKGSR